MHYDPSSETHAAFETKTDTPEKERSVAHYRMFNCFVNALLNTSCLLLSFLPFPHSKAARRKKREEAKKLPEVSKDIYYEVTTDLKEAFGTVKEIQNEQKEVSWDLNDAVNDDHDDDDHHNEIMDEASQEEIHAFSFSSNHESEPSSGFKFSFFGDDAVTKATKTGVHFISCLLLTQPNTSLLSDVQGISKWF